MEALILLLPTIFTTFTGILIAWGGYLTTVLACYQHKHNSPKVAKLCIIGITVISLGLLSLLFIFTPFASFHMLTILFAEIWYCSFLYRVNSMPSYTPCQAMFDKISSLNANLKS